MNFSFFTLTHIYRISLVCCDQCDDNFTIVLLRIIKNSDTNNLKYMGVALNFMYTRHALVLLVLVCPWLKSPLLVFSQ